jgi:hypothetical protein
MHGLNKRFFAGVRTCGQKNRAIAEDLSHASQNFRVNPQWIGG